MRAGSVFTDRKAGFSTVEILTVMVIMALLAGMISWRWNAADRSSMDRVRDDILSALTVARTRAIMSGAPQEIEVDLVARRIRPNSGTDIEIPKNMEFKAVTADELRGPDGTAQIVFLPDGTSSGGTIELQRGDQRMLIETHWLTGLSGHVRQ